MPTVPTQDRFPFLDPSLDRAALLPVAVDPQGERVLAVPGLAAEVLQALTLPQRAMRGEIDPTSERGIEEATNLAGAVTLVPIRGPAAALGSRALIPRQRADLNSMIEQGAALERAGAFPRTPESTLVAHHVEDALARTEFLLRPAAERTSGSNPLSPETASRFLQFLARNRWTVPDAVASRKVFTEFDANYTRRLNNTLRDIEFGSKTEKALTRSMNLIISDQVRSFLSKIPQRGESRADLALRLRRRREAGFEQTLFHGTGGSEFDVFDLKRARIPDETAVFFSPSRDIAGVYGQRIIEVTVRAENPVIIDLTAIRGRPLHYDNRLVRETIKAAKEADKDVVVLQNLQDVGGLQDQVLVLDPRKIRSTDARFDPGTLGSANIFTGIAGAVAAPYILRAFEEPTLEDVSP